MGGVKRVVASFGAVAVGVTGLAGPAEASGAGVVALVSQVGGTPMHRTSQSAMSDDGSRFAFVANGDGLRNLLLVDRAAGTVTEVVSDTAEFPRMSGDGSVVLYRRLGGLFEYDVAAGTSAFVASNAVAGGVSGDGRFVSLSTPSGVFLRDRAAGTTTPLPPLNFTLSPSGYSAGSVSDDGSVVAFTAEVSVAPNPFRTRQAFVWRAASNSTAIVSVDESGVAGAGSSTVDDLTPDGRFLAMSSRAPLTSADPNASRSDVYVRDLVAGTTAFVGANFHDDDYPNSGDSSEAALSEDGSLVAYRTDARIAGKWDNESDVVLADRPAGTLHVVSRALDGSPAGASFEPRLSADGRFAAFTSAAIDIVSPFDVSGCREVDDGEVNYGNCSNVYVVDRLATGGVVGSGGGTVSTADGATSVFVPPGFPGTVTIAPVPASSPVPDGYEVLGQQVVIEAPVATWSAPLRLTFTVDGSLGVAAADVAVIRDGVPLVDCLGSSTALPPDAASADGHPCVTSRTTAADGDVVVVVLTPHASVWTTAKVPPPATPDVTFASLCEATQTAVSHKGLATSLCAKLSAASASVERGDGPSAARQLDAYRAELSAQSGKAVSAAAASDLIEKSRLL